MAENAPEPFSALHAVGGADGTVEAPEAVSGPQDASEPLPVGIHEISSERYHADPCERPSLSAGIAHLLTSSTPLHAWWQHPRLNPNFERTEKESFDIGTVAHELILEGTNERVEVLDYPDWRKKDAQADRDWARKRGRIPLLAKDWARVELMVETVRAQLKARDDDPPLLTDGVPEPSIVWEERGGVLCRARFDWLREDLVAADDLKTTAKPGGANPVLWGNRTLWSIGSDVQVAFYLRGLKKLTGETPEWRYILVESVPPFAISVVSLSPDALQFGQLKVERAIERWRECTATGVWPGYPTATYYAETPPWVEMQFLEQDGEALNR